MKLPEEKAYIPQNAPMRQVPGHAPEKGKEAPQASFSNSIIKEESSKVPQQMQHQSMSKPQIKDAPPVKGNGHLEEELGMGAAMAILHARIAKITKEVLKVQIENNHKIAEANSKEMIVKLNEQIKKMEEVEKKALASKILGWLGAALSIIVGVATIVAGGAGVGLIVAGVAAATLMTLEETGVMAKAQKALAGAIEKSLIENGMDAKEAKKTAGIIATVVLTVAAIAVTVGPAFASAGAGIVKASVNVEKMARTASVAAKAVSGASMTSAGGVGVSTSVDERDAQMKGVEASTLRAMTTLIRDENSDLVKDMDNLNKIVSQSYTTAMDIINSHIQSQKRVAESIKSNA